MKCRFCQAETTLPFLDLHTAPPSNAYLSKDQLLAPEVWYPLVIKGCPECFLVQTEDYAGREALFSADYAYFSSFSSTWIHHARQYVDKVRSRFCLSEGSMVMEVASNDGYLLQFVRENNIPCLGIEPTHSTAEAARRKGIEVCEEFFGLNLAKKLRKSHGGADLMVANNVLAHVPDINDFVSGFAALLKADGVATFEFPHLLNMVRYNQFDTAYHEHYSYLSLHAVTKIFHRHGLRVFDVETLETHGGSLRVYACLQASSHTNTSTVDAMLNLETEAGVLSPEFYAGFQSRALFVRNALLNFLLRVSHDGLKVAAYGAAAKGNTFLNFAGIRSDLLEFVVDRNPAKAGKFMPGSRIPIVDEQVLKESRPDYILILPWNLRSEISAQLDYVRAWGAKFVVAIPELEIFEPA